MKLFIRTDPQVIKDALSNSLPSFIAIYKGITTDAILKEAYSSLRWHAVKNNQGHRSFIEDKDESIVALDDSVKSTGSAIKVVLKSKPATPAVEAKPVATIKEKSEGKVINKKDKVLELLEKGTSVKDIIKIFEADGLSISQVYISKLKKKV